MSSWPNKKQYLIACVLFVVTFIVYWVSIPHSFNTAPEHRQYFDSDGEFIVRQFRQEKTYTHNDHLLYHITGKFLHDHSLIIPGVHHDPVRAHKIMSSICGGAGVALLYLLGVCISAGDIVSLMSALIVGGSAGWWFFSATIDTYLPCLAVSILALGLAVLAMKTRNVIYFALLGATAGLALLLRTDSFLLAGLGLVLLADLKKAWRNMAVTAIAGIVVGGAGYFILAHACYDVAWPDIYAWSFGSLQRPEAEAEKIWGVTKNLSCRNTGLVLVNQLLYSVCLPELDTTRDARFLLTYEKGAWITVALYIASFGTAIWFLARNTLKSVQSGKYDALMLPGIAVLWFVSRTVFYTWWDPFDPFLFAVMSLPALWIVIISGFKIALEEHISGKPRLALVILICLTAVGIWSHNIYYLITPLRELCAG